MISCMQDSQWPERARVTVRGLEFWITMDEVDQLWKQLGHVLANPILPIEKPVRLFQLYDPKGEQL